MAKPIITAQVETKHPGATATGGVFLSNPDDAAPIEDVEFSLDGTSGWASLSLSVPGYGDVTSVLDEYEPVGDGFIGGTWASLYVAIDSGASEGYKTFWVRVWNGSQYSDPVKVVGRVAWPISGAAAGLIETYENTEHSSAQTVYSTVSRSFDGRSVLILYREDGTPYIGQLDVQTGALTQLSEAGPSQHSIDSSAMANDGCVYYGVSDSDPSDADAGLWRYDPNDGSNTRILSGAPYNRISRIVSDGRYVYFITSDFGAGTHLCHVYDTTLVTHVGSFSVPYAAQKIAVKNGLVAYIRADVFGSREHHVRVFDSTTGNEVWSSPNIDGLTTFDFLNDVYWYGDRLLVIVGSDLGAFSGTAYEIDVGESSPSWQSFPTHGEPLTFLGVLFRSAWAPDRILAWDSTIGSISALQYILVYDQNPRYPEGEGGASEPPTAPIPTDLEFPDDEPETHDEMAVTQDWWTFQQADEGSDWTIDLYTTDPDGEATEWTFEVRAGTVEWHTSEVVAGVNQTIPVYLGGSNYPAGELILYQEATGQDSEDIPELPPGAAATCRIRFIPRPYLYGRIESEPILIDDGEGGQEDTGYRQPTGDSEAFEYPSWYYDYMEMGEAFFINDGYERGLAIWVRVTDDRGLTSAAKLIRVSLEPVPTGPTVPKMGEGEPTQTDEDVNINFTLNVDYPGDFTDDGADYLAILVNPDPDATFDDEEWGTSITVYDNQDPEKVAGTVTLSGSPSKSNRTVSAVFNPAANYSGSTTFGVMADSGDNSAVDPGNTPEGFALGSITFTVSEVNDPPSAVSLTMPTVNEDEASVGTATWTDSEFDPEDPQGPNKLWISVDREQWDDGSIFTAHMLVEVLDEDYEDLTAQVRATPEANWSGTDGFWVSATDPQGARGPATWVTVTVNDVPDIPSAPRPGRMPTVDKGQVAHQTFTSVDPDGGPWTWEISSNRVSWSDSSASLSDGTAALSQDGTLTAQVAYTPDAGSRGEYSFWLRVKDSTGLISEPTLVRGYVSPEPAQGELQRLVRGSSATEIENLGPVPMRGLAIIEAHGGPGGCEFAVPADRIRQIADDLGETPQDVLRRWTTEPVVYWDGQPRFSGPITEEELSADGSEYNVVAEGLEAHLGTRRVEDTDGLSWAPEDQGQIAADAISHTQGQPYGDLAIDVGTVSATGTTRNEVAPFGTNIADFIDGLASKPDNPLEWRINPDRELETAARLGQDLRGQIVFTERNTSDLTIQGVDRQLATVVVVVGASHIGTASASTSVLEDLGRHVKKVEAEYLTTQQQVNDAAADILAAHLSPVRQVTFTHHVDVRSPIGPFDYHASDLVTVEAETDAGFEVLDVRIITRTVRFSDSDPNAFTIEVEAEELPKGATGAVSTRVGFVPRDWAKLIELSR